MNKKDVAAIRRQFKLDSDLLTISDIYNVFIRREISEMYHEKNEVFSLLDRKQQELFLANFKKVLSGKLGEKLFKVRFKRETVEQPSETQHMFYEAFQT